jgi:hypothetical protein
MPFDQKTRNLLQRTVAECRGILDREFTSQLQELYGIQPTGAMVTVESLTHLGDEQREVARLLRDRLAHRLVSQLLPKMARRNPSPQSPPRAPRRPRHGRARWRNGAKQQLTSSKETYRGSRCCVSGFWQTGRKTASSSQRYALRIAEWC